MNPTVPSIEAAVLALSRAEPRLEPFITKHGLPPLEPQPNTFRALTRAIIFQQLSGKAAATICGRFEALFPGDDFPTPEQVLRKTTPKLRSVGLSGQKTNYIRDLAKHFRAGAIDAQRFPGMEDDDIAEELTRVKGIGRWSADMFLIFALNRPDVLPVGDLGVRKGFQLLFEMEALPSTQEMIERAEPWRPYRSYAAWYLWRVCETVTPEPKAAATAKKPASARSAASKKQPVKPRAKATKPPTKKAKQSPVTAKRKPAKPSASAAKLLTKRAK